MPVQIFTFASVFIMMSRLYCAAGQAVCVGRLANSVSIMLVRAKHSPLIRSAYTLPQESRCCVVRMPTG